MAAAVKPEVEIWRRPKKSTVWPWFPIHSFRQFFARTYRFATKRYRQTDDRRHTVPMARPIVRSAKKRKKSCFLKFEKHVKYVFSNTAHRPILLLSTSRHPFRPISLVKVWGLEIEKKVLWSLDWFYCASWSNVWCVWIYCITNLTVQMQSKPGSTFWASRGIHIETAGNVSLRMEKFHDWKWWKAFRYFQNDVFN